MRLVELTNQNRAAWDEYVRRSPDSLPFHLSGWQHVLRETYGYDTPYVMATDSGPSGTTQPRAVGISRPKGWEIESVESEGERVVGVLPLFAVRSLLVGKMLTTTPGGLCADNDQVSAALIERGREVASDMKVDRLVLHDSRRAWPGEMQTRSHHVAWIVDLCSDLDELWKGVNRNVRRQVRMARDNGLDVEIGTSSRLVDDFYAVISHFTHEAGTPVFGRAFFENVVSAFAGCSYILVVYRDGRPLGAYYSMSLHGTCYGIWGATIREYLPLRAAYLAYWEMMQYAATDQCRSVDMGRSPTDSNASRFKGQWGGYSMPVFQQVAPVNTERSPRQAEDIAGRVRTDRKFQAFTRLWSRLPFPVAQFLGPRLRRHVPFA